MRSLNVFLMLTAAIPAFSTSSSACGVFEACPAAKARSAAETSATRQIKASGGAKALAAPVGPVKEKAAPAPSLICSDGERLKAVEAALNSLEKRFQAFARSTSVAHARIDNLETALKEPRP